MEIELSLDDTAGEYTLLFEGPADATPETMRKIKGVFLAELEMPIEKISLILQNTPAPVISSDDASSLEHPYRLLKQAGSKVLIVTSDGTPFNPDEIKDHEDVVVFELSGSLDLDDGLDLVNETQLKSPTYELPDESSLSLDSLLEEAAADIPESRADELGRSEMQANEYKLDLDLSDEPPALVAVSVPATEQVSKSSETPPSLAFDYSLQLDDSDVAAAPKAASSPVKEPSTFITSLELDMPDEAPLQNVPVAQDAGLALAPIEEPQAALTPPESMPEEESLEDETTLEVEPVQEASPIPPQEPAVIKAPPPPAPSVKAEAKPAPAAPRNVAVESSGEATEINIVPIRAKTRKKLPPAVETGLLIAIGSVILIIANWFYFNAPPAVDVEAEKQAESRALMAAQKRDILLNKKQAAQALVEQENAALSMPITYSGDVSVSAYTIHLEVIIANKIPTQATFTIKGEAPPPLNNEQIARGEKQAPWIRRAESASFEFISAQDGNVMGTAPSKVYVEYEGISKRLVKNSYLEGQIGTDSESIHLTLSMSSDEKPMIPPPYWALSAEQQGVELNFVQSFMLKKNMLVPATPEAVANSIPLAE